MFNFMGGARPMRSAEGALARELHRAATAAGPPPGHAGRRPPARGSERAPPRRASAAHCARGFESGRALPAGLHAVFCSRVVCASPWHAAAAEAAGAGARLGRRRQAINFGIIYGQSAFGLAKGLAIPVADAKKYIETYFKRYPGIQAPPFPFPAALLPS